MIELTTHVLDIEAGAPASGMRVTLWQRSGEAWELVAERVTDEFGRITDLMPPDLEPGGNVYRLRFQSGEYYSERRPESRRNGLYPYIDVVVTLDSQGGSAHIPLLLAAYGYSTYRGC